MYILILGDLTLGLVPVCFGAARAAQLFKRFLHEAEFSVRTGTEFSRIFDGLRVTCWAISEECDSGSASCVALVRTHRPLASAENEGTGGAGSAGSAGTGSEPPHLPSSPEPAGRAARSRRTRRAGPAPRQRNRGGRGLRALRAGALPGDAGLPGRAGSGPVRLLYGVRELGGPGV